MVQVACSSRNVPMHRKEPADEVRPVESAAKRGGGPKGPARAPDRIEGLSRGSVVSRRYQVSSPPARSPAYGYRRVEADSLSWFTDLDHEPPRGDPLLRSCRTGHDGEKPRITSGYCGGVRPAFSRIAGRTCQQSHPFYPVQPSNRHATRKRLQPKTLFPGFSVISGQDQVPVRNGRRRKREGKYL